MAEASVAEKTANEEGRHDEVVQMIREIQQLTEKDFDAAKVPSDVSEQGFHESSSVHTSSLDKAEAKLHKACPSSDSSDSVDRTNQCSQCGGRVTAGTTTSIYSSTSDFISRCFQHCDRRECLNANEEWGQQFSYRFFCAKCNGTTVREVRSRYIPPDSAGSEDAWKCKHCGIMNSLFESNETAISASESNGISTITPSVYSKEKAFIDGHPWYMSDMHRCRTLDMLALLGDANAYDENTKPHKNVVEMKLKPFEPLRKTAYSTNSTIMTSLENRSISSKTTTFEETQKTTNGTDSGSSTSCFSISEMEIMKLPSSKSSFATRMQSKQVPSTDIKLHEMSSPVTDGLSSNKYNPLEPTDGHFSPETGEEIEQKAPFYLTYQIKPEEVKNFDGEIILNQEDAVDSPPKFAPVINSPETAEELMNMSAVQLITNQRRCRFGGPKPVLTSLERIDEALSPETAKELEFSAKRFHGIRDEDKKEDITTAREWKNSNEGKEREPQSPITPLSPELCNATMKGHFGLRKTMSADSTQSPITISEQIISDGQYQNNVEYAEAPANIAESAVSQEQFSPETGIELENRAREANDYIIKEIQKAQNVVAERKYPHILAATAYRPVPSETNMVYSVQHGRDNFSTESTLLLHDLAAAQTLCLNQNSREPPETKILIIQSKEFGTKTAQEMSSPLPYSSLSLQTGVGGRLVVIGSPIVDSANETAKEASTGKSVASGQGLRTCRKQTSSRTSSQDHWQGTPPQSPYNVVRIQSDTGIFADDGPYFVTANISIKNTVSGAQFKGKVHGVVTSATTESHTRTTTNSDTVITARSSSAQFFDCPLASDEFTSSSNSSSSSSARSIKKGCVDELVEKAKKAKESGQIQRNAESSSSSCTKSAKKTTVPSAQVEPTHVLHEQKIDKADRRNLLHHKEQGFSSEPQKVEHPIDPDEFPTVWSELDVHTPIRNTRAKRFGEALSSQKSFNFNEYPVAWTTAMARTPIRSTRSQRFCDSAEELLDGGQFAVGSTIWSTAIADSEKHSTRKERFGDGQKSGRSKEGKEKRYERTAKIKLKGNNYDRELPGEKVMGHCKVGIFMKTKYEPDKIMMSKVKEPREIRVKRFIVNGQEYKY